MPRKKKAATPAVPAWTTACPDWEERIVAGKSLLPCGPLFPEEAKDAMRLFNSLRIVDAPGSPLVNDAARQWLKDYAEVIFGSYNPETGERLISETLLHIAKKNWKSGFAASLALTFLIRNWRQSAELLILAPTIEVANNSYGPARDMVRADPELSELLHVQDHIRTITNLDTRATLKIVAADSEAVGGKKGSIIVVDELWIFGKRPGAEAMLREATGGLVSRAEGMVIYLTTQSDEPPAGVFASKLSYARKVRDGKINDPKFLPLLYEFPKRMEDAKEFLEPSNFRITNPNLGASVSAEWLQRELGKAQESGPEALAIFLAKHLNVEIGLSLRSDRWAGADYWEVNAEPGLTLEALLDRCEVVTIGIDGGGLDDLLGLAVIGREDGTGRWLHWGHAWAHPSVLERRKSEAARFRDFANDGDLTLVERIGDDVAEVADIVEHVDLSGRLDKIGLDPVGVGALVDAITIDKGIDPKRLVAVSQGWRLAGAIKTAERKLAEGLLKHSGSRMMAWSVGNCRVEPRGNAISITKQAAGYAKIDPVMALFDAIELMSRNPLPQGALVTGELVVL